jgi:ubiquinone/menaquinone biosynthesis C-methylase UbiE
MNAPVAETQQGARGYFDRRASRYWSDLYEGQITNHYQLLLRRRRDLVVEMLAGTEGPALEVGCGPGVLGDVLRENGRFFVGDISFNMVQHARARTGGHGAQLSATALPFRDEAVRLVTAIGVLEYVPDEALALREIHRVLAPGGVAIVTFPARKPLEDLTRRLVRLGALAAQTMTGRVLAAAAPVPPRVGEHWCADAHRLIERAGFVVERIRPFHYVYFPWAQLLFGPSRLVNGVMERAQRLVSPVGRMAQSWVFRVRKP